MIFLNIIYFLIITYYGYSFLYSEGRIIKSAFDTNNSYHYTGLELFWCLTFSTGLLAFSGNLGLDITAIRLGVLELFCILGLKLSKDTPIWSLPLKIYFVYLIWLVLGCFYGPSWGYGTRVVLKYLYVFLLCLFASSVVNDCEVFIKSSLWARKVATISIFFSFLPFMSILFPGLFWYATAGAINYISMMIFSLGLYYYSNQKKQNLIFVILFLIPCIVWVFRTSIMGSALALMMFFIFK